MPAFSTASERNKGPILEVIKPLLANAETVLEIGSGSAQHAVHFADAMPGLLWQTSDREQYLADIQARVELQALANLPPPLLLDVCSRPWPCNRVSAVFSANTAHIMSWPEVQCMFEGVSYCLDDHGLYCLYGPFNAGGSYTSSSNEAFDRSLRAQDPEMGIRDKEALCTLAEKLDLRWIESHMMPANNQILVWRRLERGDERH